MKFPMRVNTDDVYLIFGGSRAECQVLFDDDQCLGQAKSIVAHGASYFKWLDAEGNYFEDFDLEDYPSIWDSVKLKAHELNDIEDEHMRASEFIQETIQKAKHYLEAEGICDVAE